jgi:ribosomal protein S6--L-glutamate ligase
VKLCFLLERGSPPRRNPVFAEVFGRLAARGVDVATVYPEETLLRLDTLAVAADLYLLKSDTELALSLATAWEGLGARVLNRSHASALVRNKVLVAATLRQAGIPTPRSLAAAHPAQLAPELASGPLILKPHRGYHGAGIAVARAPADLPVTDAYPGLVFAQRYLTHARVDLKVFGIGDDVFGVRKAFAADSFLQAGESVPLSPEVDALARRCGRAFGLELYGLDLAEDDDEGPWVVDVNYFPGYRGVPDAACRLADYVMSAARQ